MTRADGKRFPDGPTVGGRRPIPSLAITTRPGGTVTATHLPPTLECLDASAEFWDNTAKMWIEVTEGA